MSETSAPPFQEKTGAWLYRQGSFEPLNDGRAGRAVVYVPSEDVATFIADLPLASRAQRQAAAPFAIEERVSEPLDQLHVALGAEVGPRKHLIGVVNRERMAAWLDRLQAFGLDQASVVPDAFRLPAPPAGAWSVSAADGRSLVRTAEGTGFAIPTEFLTQAWEAAGSPEVVSAGGALPGALNPLPAGLDLASSGRADHALDLRQGLFAARRAAGDGLLKTLVAVLAAGLAAHLLIATVDLVALKRIDAKKHAEALALIHQISPGVSAAADLAAELDALLPAQGGGAASAFLPMLVQTSRALAPFGSAITLRSLGYADDDKALSLKVEAADLASLQKVEAAIAAAGLSVNRGASSSENGKATGDLVIRQGGAAP